MVSSSSNPIFFYHLIPASFSPNIPIPLPLYPIPPTAHLLVTAPPWISNSNHALLTLWPFAAVVPKCPLGVRCMHCPMAICNRGTSCSSVINVNLESAESCVELKVGRVWAAFQRVSLESKRVMSKFQLKSISYDIWEARFL